MKKKAVIVGLMAFLFVLLISGTVFAEGEEPPVLAEECADCEESALSTEATSPEGLETDVALPEELLEEEGTSVEVIEGQTSETLETNELPVTEIVLVDEQGEPLDMASQASAEIMLLPDPYFYIAGLKYSYTTIMDAVNGVVAQGILPDGGLIYVEDGIFNESVYIDGRGSILAGLRGLQSDHGSAYSTIGNDVTLEGLSAGFMLKGFTINGTVSVINSTGNLIMEDLVVTSSSDTGIIVGNNTYHSGAVTLKEVKSSGNAGRGAQIYAMGNITVTNSAFDGNSDDGLYLGTKTGTVTVKGVSVSGNTGTGIRGVEFKKAVTLQQVIANNNGNGGLSFNDPEGTGAFKIDTLYAINKTLKNGDGIYLQTKGLVTLNRLIVEQFGDNGLHIDHETSTSAISLTNSTFTKNAGHGISVDSLGNILLTSVRSDDNGGSGAVLNNKYIGAIGVITISSPATGGNAAANSFAFNTGGDGLWLTSTKNITLSNLDSMGNGGCGLRAETIGALSINKTLPNWYNGFDGNGSNGIQLNVKGNVLLGYVGTSNNTGYGVTLNEPALNVTVTGGLFDNNKYSGLRILSTGNVVLTDVGSASNNDTEKSGYYHGIEIDASSGIGSVTIKNSSKTGMTWINGNGSVGLLIGAKGNVLVNGVAATGNGTGGISINNQIDKVIKVVSVSRVWTNDNADGGLIINTYGSVTLQDLIVNDNGTNGLYIYACLNDGLGGCSNISNVTMKGSNEFSRNGWEGLQIYTKGTVNFAQLYVFDNKSGGVSVQNFYSSSVAPVTIGGNSFSFISGNGGHGIYINSGGVITLKTMVVENTSNVTAGGGAVTLYNAYGQVRGVTLMDVQILGNEGTGLFIRSDGPVTLAGVESSYNSIYKGQIDVDSPTNGVHERLSGYWGSQGDEWSFYGEAGDNFTITLTSSEFTPVLYLLDEWGYLIDIDDPGTGDTAQLGFSISDDGKYILRVGASGWGMGEYELTFGGDIYDWLVLYPYHGADIITSNLVRMSSGKTVFSDFVANNANGAKIISGSTITISNAGASNNYLRGLDLHASNNNVSIGNNHKTRISFFNNNGEEGIHVLSGGSITLNNRIWVNGNGNSGIYLDNSGSILKAITVKGVNANYNTGDGLYMISSGNILLTTVETNWNERGIYAHGVGSLTINGVNTISHNTLDGLFYDMGGAINISGVTADHNGVHGISGYYINNAPVTIFKNCVMRWNQDTGVFLTGAGSVTLDGVQSLMNGGDGADLYTSIPAIIKNSTFMGNGGYGLRVLTGTFPINTFYLANDLGGIYLY